MRVTDESATSSEVRSVVFLKISTDATSQYRAQFTVKNWDDFETSRQWIFSATDSKILQSELRKMLRICANGA